MIVAYLRVSTGKQLLENQKNEISAFAQNRNMVIDQWVTEIASGCKQRNDRKLGTLLRRMKKRRFTDRYGTVSVESYADRHHDHHGNIVAKRCGPVQHKRTLQFRQLAQQQGTLLRFRACCRNRTQFDLHAHPRSACLASGTRCQARTKKKAVIPNRKYCWTTGMKLFEQSTPDRVSLLFAVSITFREKHSIGFGAIICH